MTRETVTTTADWARARSAQMWERRFTLATPTGEPITYREKRDDERYPWVHSTEAGCVLALDGDNIVGFLRWYREGTPNEFMIAQITVTREYRRQGIATRLLREARKVEPRVRHSRVRTRDGDAWAKSTGDPVPVRTTWEGKWYPWNFDSIVDDVRYVIEHESAWEEVTWTGKNSNGATSGSPSRNRSSAGSTATTAPTKTASSSKKYA